MGPHRMHRILVTEQMGITRVMVGRHAWRGDHLRTGKHRIWVSLLAVLLILSSLAACSGASSDDEQTGPWTVADALLGTGQERIDRLQKVNDLVAACMRRNGWEYTAQLVRVESYQAFYDVLDSATAAEWGYGITAPMTRSDEFNLDFGSVPSPGAQTQREYLETLDADAFAEYLRDLNGAVVSDAPEDSEESLDSMPFYEESCQGKAEAEVYGEVVFVDRLGLEEMMNQASEDVAHRLVAEGFEDEWALCMRDQGYELTKLGSANQFIYSKFVEILGDGSSAISEEAFSALKELETEELAMASADIGCMESTGLLERSQELLEEAVAEIFGETTR